MENRTPHFSRCRSGKRWFWVVKAEWFDSADESLKAEGYASTPEEARRTAESLCGSCNQQGNWMAVGRLKRINIQKRRAKPTTSGNAERLEFLYECWIHHSDYDSERYEHVERHRIVKKTKKFIFVEREPYEEKMNPRRQSGDWRDWEIRTVRLDRESFERDGSCPGIFGDFYPSPDDWRRERGNLAVPSYLANLGLNADATASEIKRAYKKLAKEHHPDNGGNPDKFKQVRRCYEQAMNAKKSPF